jgi:hypothetical protein
MPSHRINVTDGSDSFTYWYVQEPATARAFDSQKDRDLVELMHAKGQTFQLWQFESFDMGAGRNYHLQRRDSHEFVIKSLV